MEKNLDSEGFSTHYFICTLKTVFLLHYLSDPQHLLNKLCAAIILILQTREESGRFTILLRISLHFSGTIPDFLDSNRLLFPLCTILPKISYSCRIPGFKCQSHIYSQEYLKSFFKQFYLPEPSLIQYPEAQNRKKS